MAENVLYYGDNLDILRRYIKDETAGSFSVPAGHRRGRERSTLR